MSMAFNAKNLHYEKQEPAFLRKLRGEHSSDRHNVQIARPKKSRIGTGDDDGPTIVDEAGGDVSKEEYEQLLNGEEEPAKLEQTNAEGTLEVSTEVAKTSNSIGEHERQRVAEIGGPKKRKHAKVVGEDVEEKSAKKSSPKQSESINDEPKSRTKGKKKLIKLSFDEPGD